MLSCGRPLGAAQRKELKLRGIAARQRELRSHSPADCLDLPPDWPGAPLEGSRRETEGEGG